MRTMKNLKYTITFLLVVLLSFSCTREADDLVPARFPTTAEIFTDNPVGLTDQFFVSFDPASGANTSAFDVDNNEAFEGTSSIRIDVPSPNDPNGVYVGGIFEDRGSGRDLTDYNALTFYAKASTQVTLESVGFGNDFGENRFEATRSNLEITTGWQQYIVPIPDPSKLVQESGMFIFVAQPHCPEGPGLCENDSRNGSGGAGDEVVPSVGYTLWIDEIRFENLPSVAQPLKKALDLQYLINVAGTDVTVNAAANYFEPEDFNFAPTPPSRNAEDVISILSDAYDNIPVSRYNSFFEPFQKTLGGLVTIDNGEVTESFIRYTELNFVGIVFNPNIFPDEAVPTIDLTEFTHLHVDFYIRDEIENGDQILLELTNYGSSPGAGNFSIDFTGVQNESWIQYDIPLSNFSGPATKDAIGLLLFNSNEDIRDILVDNIYFYKE